MHFKYKFSLDQRRKLNNGLFPIKVNVHIYQTNKNRPFSLPDYYTSKGRIVLACADKKEFDSIWSDRHKKNSFGEITGETTVYGNKQEVRNVLKIYADILDDLIGKTDLRDFKAFKKAFLNYKFDEDKQDTNVWKAFDKWIKELEEEGRYKYAASIRSTKNEVWKYREKKEGLEAWENRAFTFIEIDKSFLQKYERYRLKEGLSKGTVGVDATNLRTLYNLNKTKALENFYPFGKKGGYVIPTATSKNQGLSKADVKKIRDFSSEVYYLQQARDYFMFCFYNGGMNIKDVALLKKEQTEFMRAKTITTAKKIVRIKLNFNDITNDVIERNKGRGKYMFDILDDSDGDYEIFKKVNAKNKSVSKHLKNICKMLKIDHKATANWSRHSNTTILFGAGVNLKAISEGLGHTNIKTTEGYIDTMIDKEKDKIDEALNLDDQ